MKRCGNCQGTRIQWVRPDSKTRVPAEDAIWYCVPCDRLDGMVLGR